MKSNLLILVACSLLLMAAGCNNYQKGQEPKTLSANVAAPTWTAPTDYDYTASMTAIIRVDLTKQYPTAAAGFALNEGDQLAAFAGDNCLGVAELNDGLFFLYVVSPANNEVVTLRYYSANYKNLFEAKNAFSFANDARLGTTAEPFVPAFVVAQ